MMYSIFLRTLYDKRWFLLGWSLALSVMALLMIAMFPSLSKGMADIAKSLPPAIQGIVGNINDFAHIDSYLSSQLYDIRIPIFLMIMSVVLAQNLSVGSEEKGEMRTLLSTAASRSKLYFETLSAAALIFAVAITVTSIVTKLGVMMIGESLDTWLIVQLALLSFLFAMVAYTVIFAVGMATGSRSAALSVGVGLIVTSIILEAGRTVDWLDIAQKISLLHYYDAGKLLGSGVDIKHLLVQFGILIVSVIVGWLLYRRRDIS